MCHIRQSTRLVHFVSTVSSNYEDCLLIVALVTSFRIFRIEAFRQRIIEPTHGILALFVLRNFILEMRMCRHPVGLDVWFLVGLRPLPYFMWANSEGSGETARMRRLAWAFARRLCGKYHNLMSWLNCLFIAWPSFARQCRLFIATCKI